MNIKTLLRAASAAVAAVTVLTLSAPNAYAHYLWSENTPHGNAIYFGGVDEGVREVSPGRLDEFHGLALQVQHLHRGQVSLQERSARKTAQAFMTGPALGADDSLVGSDLSVAVTDLSAYRLGILKLDFYLRHQQIDRVFPAVLALDAVATGTPGQLRISFHGQPLARQKAKLVAPNGWLVELQADDEGRVSLPTPWRGNYLLEVTYFENSSGQFEGRAYERIRHRLALTIVQPKGPATFTPEYHTPDHAD